MLSLKQLLCSLRHEFDPSEGNLCDFRIFSLFWLLLSLWSVFLDHFFLFNFIIYVEHNRYDFLCYRFLWSVEVFIGICRLGKVFLCLVKLLSVCYNAAIDRILFNNERFLMFYEVLRNTKLIINFLFTFGNNWLRFVHNWLNDNIHLVFVIGDFSL